ncbi:MULTISPECIES: hybrid sensor histidine kinase/response regulator [Spirulina sp. CCY15215]|uniref:hybrid sensor histidine kinase/response regulator n=1 Tax=Spirulina sp. CCY15215 TaxID=2767591 RepID=UPI00194E5343|nr:hybrid sensor histidine kinase/response regulator [Spirulina major]
MNVTDSMDSNPEILIVDDTPNNIRVLTAILQDKQYRVRTFLRGSRALETVKRNPPDLILLDIQMPEMDGYEFCDRIKKSPDLCEIPIIFISALDESMDKIRAFQLGGADYVTKPFQELEVLARVEHQLKLQKANKSLKFLNQTLEDRVKERTLELEEINRQKETLLETLKEKNIALQEIDRLKDEFLMVMSHELRNPLNGILGALQLILEGYCDNQEEERDNLKIAKESALYLLKTINSILDIAKIKAGRIQVYLQEIDLRIYLSSAIDIYSGQLKQKNLTLHYQEDSQPLIIQGDETKLTQIFLNIIDNAIKFTESGDIFITTQHKFDADPQKNWAIITIQDTGIGIESDRQSLLFKPFLMLDSSTTRSYEGLGLGLVIAKSWLELMGGTIRLESAGENCGTTAIISLPLSQSIAVDPEMQPENMLNSS